MWTVITIQTQDLMVKEMELSGAGKEQHQRYFKIQQVSLSTQQQQLIQIKQ